MKHKGVGPSATTIYHYVVEFGLVGMSPRKPGPEGYIPRDMYKVYYVLHLEASCASTKSMHQEGTTIEVK